MSTLLFRSGSAGWGGSNFHEQPNGCSSRWSTGSGRRVGVEPTWLQELLQLKILQDSLRTLLQFTLNFSMHALTIFVSLFSVVESFPQVQS